MRAIDQRRRSAAICFVDRFHDMRWGMAPSSPYTTLRLLPSTMPPTSPAPMITHESFPKFHQPIAKRKLQSNQRGSTPRQLKPNTNNINTAFLFIHLHSTMLHDNQIDGVLVPLSTQDRSRRLCEDNGSKIERSGYCPLFEILRRAHKRRPCPQQFAPQGRVKRDSSRT